MEAVKNQDYRYNYKWKVRVTIDLNIWKMQRETWEINLLEDHAIVKILNGFEITQTSLEFEEKCVQGVNMPCAQTAKYMATNKAT